MRAMRAIVTAGGTVVPIDGARMIGNSSSGRFLWAIARVLARAGVEVTVVGSQRLFELVHHSIPKGIAFRSYTTYDDLTRELDAAIIASHEPDLLFMGAAVSDFGPAETVQGKISSDSDEITLNLRRLPKIIDGLRRKCGQTTFIAGFKMTVGATDEQMVAAAREQVSRCRLNLVVANDKLRLSKEAHPIVMVTPEGGAIPVGGSHEDVAARLVEFVLARADTTWCRSVNVGRELASSERDVSFSAAGDLLELAQEMRLLPGKDGNVSVRASDGAYWVTPRGTLKSSLVRQRLVRVSTDLERGLVHYVGNEKPSIDSSVYGRLYREFPDVAGFLHFHDGFVVPDAVTEKPFPCGTREEAEEILRALSRATATYGYDCARDFCVELVHHGHLIGFEVGGVERLRREWSDAKSAYLRHLDEIGESGLGAHIVLTPIFQSTRIIGVVARTVEGWHSVFLLPSARGGGIGPEVMKMIGERKLVIAAHDRCEVTDYYEARGFRIREKNGNLAILEPPTLRHDVVTAATVCVWHRPSDSILLIRRGSELWHGLWANPGGMSEIGESLEQTALRELKEETGLALVGTLLDSRQCYVGQKNRIYDVTCFLYAVASRTVPEVPAGGEIAEAAWFTRERALGLPMGPGTKEAVKAFFKRR